MKTEFLPDRIIVGDRAYYRPLFGAVTFPTDSPLGYVLLAGELYRPTEYEISGQQDTPVDVEPFRSVVKGKQEGPWRYSEDVILEIIGEALCANLRELLETVCDLAEKYRTPYFYCPSKQRDAAFQAGHTLADIMRRRIARHKAEDWRFTPRTEYPSILPIRSQDKEYMEGIVRSLIGMNRLLFNQDCRHILAENPIALEALSVAAFVGTAYRLRVQEQENIEPLVNTYSKEGR